MKDKLTEYQKREGLTRAALARRVGLTRGFITLYLNGTKNMGVDTASRVSKITGVPVLDLLRVSSRSAR